MTGRGRFLPMTSPLGRLRPERPQVRRVDDLAATFDLATSGAAPADRTFTGVTMSSGDVEPGDLFVAVPGLKVHGARFAADAVARGAVAVLTDADGVRAVPPDVPVLVADDPRALAGPVAAWALDDPASRLVTIGVTGTNGKTTTTYFVDAALRAVHARTAVLGTVELRIGEDAVESPRTTVEAPVLQALMAVAHERGAGALTTEVSSHALALGRVRGVRFDVVGFTNLQRDHLDFHGDMEGYFRDKSRLFAPEQARRGVVVVDDAWGRRLAEESPIPVETVSTHVGAPVAGGADWAVVEADIGLDGVGSRFVLRGPGGARHEARVQTRSVGHTVTSSRNRASRAGPIPSTSPSCSTSANGPFACLNATIDAAVTGPTPGSESSVASSAALRSIFPCPGTPPASPSGPSPP